MTFGVGRGKLHAGPRLDTHEWILDSFDTHGIAAWEAGAAFGWTNMSFSNCEQTAVMKCVLDITPDCPVLREHWNTQKAAPLLGKADFFTCDRTSWLTKFMMNCGWFSKDTSSSGRSPGCLAALESLIRRWASRRVVQTSGQRLSSGHLPTEKRRC